MPPCLQPELGPVTDPNQYTHGQFLNNLPNAETIGDAVNRGAAKHRTFNDAFNRS